MRIDNEFPRNADFSINWQTFISAVFSDLSSHPLFIFRTLPQFPVSSMHLFSLRIGKTSHGRAFFLFPGSDARFMDTFFFWKDLPHGSRNRWAVLKSLPALLPPLLRQVSYPSSHYSHEERQKRGRNSFYDVIWSTLMGKIIPKSSSTLHPIASNTTNSRNFPGYP